MYKGRAVSSRFVNGYHEGNRFRPSNPINWLQCTQIISGRKNFAVLSDHKNVFFFFCKQLNKNENNNNKTKNLRNHSKFLNS